MKSRVLAAVFAVVLTAGTLTGCGSTKTADTAKTEDTKVELHKAVLNLAKKVMPDKRKTQIYAHFLEKESV